MTLSILICSLKSRQTALNKLLEELHRQIGDYVGIEVLTSIDNKEATTGAKRQALLEAATGKYIIYIDDDDQIEPCYISELLIAANLDADCFAINGYMTTNGQNKIEWRLSKNYENVTIKEGGRSIYLRKTNHITAVKREIALQVGFPSISNAEDKWYSDRVAPLCKTEYTITPCMYHYRFMTSNKEYK